jgi:hypothetical protein
LENQTDYQPPYDPIEIPTYCMTPPLMFPGPDDPPAIALPPEVTRSSAIPEVPTTPALPPFTFVTTDKNPSVVIVSSEGPPQYGQSGDVQPTFVVTASGQDVIINLSTFVGLSSGLTTTVTVDGGTFTISPTAVVGQGGSVPRPPPAPGGGGGLVTPPPPLETKTESETGTGGQDVIVNNHVQQPTNVVVAGAQLLTAIGPSIVVIHSTTITYGPSVPETSAVVGDETVSIGPSEVVVHGVTLGGTSLAPTSTEYEVVGGVTITQIGTGVIVIDHTTYTGDDDEPLTTSLHGELITIGPDQVVVANHTFSGAPPTYDSVVVSTIQPTGTGAEETGGGQSSDNSGDDEEDDAASLHGPHSGSLLLSVAIGIMVSM